MGSTRPFRSLPRTLLYFLCPAERNARLYSCSSALSSDVDHYPLSRPRLRGWTPEVRRFGLKFTVAVWITAAFWACFVLFSLSINIQKILLRQTLNKDLFGVLLLHSTRRGGTKEKPWSDHLWGQEKTKHSLKVESKQEGSVSAWFQEVAFPAFLLLEKNNSGKQNPGPLSAGVLDSWADCRSPPKQLHPVWDSFSSCTVFFIAFLPFSLPPSPAFSSHSSPNILFKIALFLLPVFLYWILQARL